MIKSIKNDNILIGSAQDLFNNVYWRDGNFIGRFKLPLFSVFPELITAEDLENDRNLICFMMRNDFCRYNNIIKRGFSLSLVEYINKAWSEFYDQS